MRRVLPLALSILTAFSLAVAAGAQDDASEEPSVFPRNHTFEVLEHETAEAMAWEACPPEGRDYWCRVNSASPHNLTVTADADTHARIAAAIAAAEAVPSSQVFQVILLQAENNGDSGLAKLPAQARRALTDAREFLPYNGYQMLGSALLRTDARARSIVNGPDGQDYSASLTYRDSVTRDGHQLVLRQFALDKRVQVSGDDGEERIESMPILGTSFSMKPGETVIVGTSKLEGADRALVVLLTAVL